MRAAGFWAGLATAILDTLKASVAAGLAIMLFPLAVSPAYAWVHIFAPLASILGHNYSLFLISRDENGRLKLHGGAGGAPCVGGAFGLWPPSILITIPTAGLILFGIGYASLTTMGIGLVITILFAYRAWLGLNPWQYALYGFLAELMLMYSLRPNIQRLIQGRERLVGWRARKQHARTES